jgi:hypothetical protein
MTGKVSGSQVPGSPEGEKQGWAGEGGSGFWRVFREVGEAAQKDNYQTRRCKNTKNKYL